MCGCSSAVGVCSSFAKGKQSTVIFEMDDLDGLLDELGADLENGGTSYYVPTLSGLYPTTCSSLCGVIRVFVCVLCVWIVGG